MKQAVAQLARKQTSCEFGPCVHDKAGTAGTARHSRTLAKKALTRACSKVDSFPHHVLPEQALLLLQQLLDAANAVRVLGCREARRGRWRAAGGTT